jgi:NodT family efflux transporter outer membrane factor (OMF) lipoprotein
VSRRRVVLALALAPVLGCTATPPPVESIAPQAEVAWREELLQARATPPGAWWKEFRDPALDELVELAFAASPSVGAARLRVQVAREERRVAAGARQVQANLTAGAALQQTSANRPGGAFLGGVDPLYAGGVEFSWEIDAWGRLDAEVAAADEAVELAVELRRMAADALVAELARERALLRGAQGELRTLDEGLALLEDALELERARLAAGLTTELDVARAEAEVLAARALRPTVLARGDAARHRLAGLAACDVSVVSRLVADEAAAGVVPTELALGAPLDALENRADLRRARREVLRQTALLGVAEAETKPRLSIAAALGAQADDLGELADASSRTWSLGGSILAPLFTGDRLAAARDAQLARAEAAAEDWRAAVLAAWTEVESAIVELRRERERELALVAQVAVESRALDLARDRHGNGLVDYFEVLAARRALVIVEQELARSRTQLALKTVALLRAVGGQWRHVDE